MAMSFHRRRLAPAGGSESFNATTSYINLGLAPQLDLTLQSFLCLCYPIGSGEGTASYLHGATTALSSAGHRNAVGDTTGDARFTASYSTTGNAGTPEKYTPDGSITYGSWWHLASTYVNTVGSSGITQYVGKDGALLADVGTGNTFEGSGSTTTTTGKNKYIGNRPGADRTMNGYIAYVARWNRVLSFAELLDAQQRGPMSVPHGLVLCWANGKDYGPYNLRPTSTTDISQGATTPLSNIGYIPSRRYFIGLALQYLYPISDIASNGWLPSTGGTLYGVLDETVASDADYIYSPSDPTTQQFEVRLTSGGDPLSSSNHTITVRLQAIGADTSFDLDLVQNTTVLDSWTENVTVAAGVAERSRTLSGAVADSITDYTNLRIRGVARAP